MYVNVSISKDGRLVILAKNEEDIEKLYGLLKKLGLEVDAEGISLCG